MNRAAGGLRTPPLVRTIFAPEPRCSPGEPRGPARRGDCGSQGAGRQSPWVAAVPVGSAVSSSQSWWGVRGRGVSPRVASMESPARECRSKGLAGLKPCTRGAPLLVGPAVLRITALPGDQSGCSRDCAVGLLQDSSFECNESSLK